MARLDLYALPKGRPGFLVDVQADLLSHLASRTVIPLLPEGEAPAPVRELNPVFAIDGQRYVLVTQSIVSLPEKDLRRPIGSMREQHDAITRALDILLLGF